MFCLFAALLKLLSSAFVALFYSATNVFRPNCLDSGSVQMDVMRNRTTVIAAVSGADVKFSTHALSFHFVLTLRLCVKALCCYKLLFSQVSALLIRK